MVEHWLLARSSALQRGQRLSQESCKEGKECMVSDESERGGRGEVWRQEGMESY